MAEQRVWEARLTSVFGDDDWYVWPQEGGWIANVNGEANARLIAAAPELVAALENAAAGFAVIAHQVGETHPGLADVSNLESVRGFALENFQLAREVLAKVKDAPDTDG